MLNARASYYSAIVRAIGISVGIGGLAAIAAACSAQAHSAPPTWNHDVRPIVSAKCQSCHTQGGFAPFPMDSYADAVAHRASIASAVANRTMPPWPPNDSCNTYQHDRSLSEAQRNTLLAWATGEAPEGSPASYVPPAEGAAVALKIDRSIGAAAPYVPAISPDEYRCFVIDWNETNTKYVTGLRVTPGAISEVHHAIVFQIAPQDVAAVQKLDDADPAAGYSCFGTPGVDGAGWVGAWVPGSTGEVFPADTGIAIVPGSKLVVQMHYNTANTPPVPDRSTVDLQLADTVKTEAAVLKWTNPSWVFNHTMSIAAGDADSVQQFSFAPTNFMVKASGVRSRTASRSASGQPRCTCTRAA